MEIVVSSFIKILFLLCKKGLFYEIRENTEKYIFYSQAGVRKLRPFFFKYCSRSRNLLKLMSGENLKALFGCEGYGSIAEQISDDHIRHQRFYTGTISKVALIPLSVIELHIGFSSS